MRLMLGLDIHKRNSSYCMLDNESKIQMEGIMESRPEKILGLVEPFPRSVLEIGMESSTYIYPIYDALKDAGYKVKVAHPMKLARITKALSKNDKKDARQIAKQLLRDDFPESYMLTKEQREKRELVREHLRLTQQKTRIKNQIHSHIAKHNYRLTCTLGNKKSIVFLNALPIKGVSRIKLNLLVTQLQQIKSALRIIKNEIHHEALINEEIRKLMRLDGIHEYSAAVLLFELGNWKRFSSVKELTSYVGLIPCMYSSGGKSYFGRMRYDGNTHIKYALTRAAEQAIRKPNKFQAFYLKLIKKGKKRRTALGAVANKLLRCCYGVLHNEELAYQALIEMG